MAALGVRARGARLKQRSRKPPKRAGAARAPRRGKEQALVLRAAELDALREELEAGVAAAAPPGRWSVDPKDVRRSVGRLVLTLVEFVRKLLERQAIRRMEADAFTPEETEAVGLALMRLEETIQELAQRFDLSLDELNLELGPLGRLM